MPQEYYDHIASIASCRKDYSKTGVKRKKFGKNFGWVHSRDAFVLDNRTINKRDNLYKIWRNNHAPSSRSRNWIYRQKHETCEECGVNKAVHTHHIVKVEEGGRDSDSNLMALCLECHRDKHPDIKNFISLTHHKRMLLGCHE